jgi:hypothetical protein
MTDNTIGEKERIQILLAEYNSLRSEILARTTSVYQVAAISALAAIWLLQQQIGKRLLVGGTLAVIGLSICAWVLARDSMRAALRVQELEKEINRRAGEHLLVWDNEWGGMTTTLWGSRTIRILLGLNRPPYSK